MVLELVDEVPSIRTGLQDGRLVVSANRTVATATYPPPLHAARATRTVRPGPPAS